MRLGVTRLVRWEDDAFHDRVMNSFGEDMLQPLRELHKGAFRSLESREGGMNFVPRFRTLPRTHV